MRTHFIQYETELHASTNKSKEGDYHIRTKRNLAVAEGDVIWLISGRKDASKKTIYSLEYHLVVQKSSKEKHGDEIVYRSTNGGIVKEDQSIKSEMWFQDLVAEFHKSKFNFRAAPETFFKNFEDLLKGKSYSRSDDDLEGLGQKASELERRTLRSILDRRGQNKFRQKLLSTYRGRCCVTGCSVEYLLEAAHINPHSEEENYEVENGLLMRSDIHTLFDLNLLAIDESGRIFVSELVQDESYRSYHLKYADLPARGDGRPDISYLNKRLELMKDRRGEGPIRRVRIRAAEV